MPETTDTTPSQNENREPPNRARYLIPLGLIVVVILFATILLLSLPWAGPFDITGRLWDFGGSQGAPLSDAERASRTEAGVQATIALAQLLTVIALTVAGIAAILNFRQAQDQARRTEENTQKQFRLAQQQAQLTQENAQKQF